MIVVEEKESWSNKTDASLYNVQPTKNRVKKPSLLGLCRGAKEEGNSQPTDTGKSVTVLELHPARPPSKYTRMGCR